MRVTLKEAALLALPTLSNAVSLSDMTPRAYGLTGLCQTIYTSQIPSCTPSDFTSEQCSQDCIGALYGLAQGISHACAGVTGQNLVVAFLAGVGPQQLCHNVGTSTPTVGPPTSMPRPTQTHWTPSIGSSTITAPKPTNTGSLLVDTSSTQTATIISHHETTTSSSSSQPAQTTSQTHLFGEHTTPTQSPTTGTATTSAAGNSQTSLNDHSGGGSPFDTSGNMNAAPSVSLALRSVILSATAALLLALR